MCVRRHSFLLCNCWFGRLHFTLRELCCLVFGIRQAARVGGLLLVYANLTARDIVALGSLKPSRRPHWLHKKAFPLRGRWVSAANPDEVESLAVSELPVIRSCYRHLIRQPACGRRRLPPSPQGEGLENQRTVPFSFYSRMLYPRD